MKAQTDDTIRQRGASGSAARTTPRITFDRLTKVSPAALAAHMSDPRMAEHMPLLNAPWDIAAAERFVAAKEAAWRRDGLGHWAILADSGYVGWGGFQKMAGEWDYGLVLRPDAFGLGPSITKLALAFARADPRIGHVTLLLPPTRRNLGAISRLGGKFVAEVALSEQPFRKYRLETPGRR